jgi:hypothetical protein
MKGHYTMADVESAGTKPNREPTLSVLRIFRGQAMLSSFNYGFWIRQESPKNHRIPQEQTAGAVSMLLRQDA